MKKFLFIAITIFISVFANQTKAGIIYSGPLLNIALNSSLPSPANEVTFVINGQALKLMHEDFFGTGFQIDGNLGAVGCVDFSLNAQQNLLRKLNAGDIVNGSQNFITPMPAPNAKAYHVDGAFASPPGYCINDGESTYFGFKILSAGNTYYGWIQVLRFAPEVAIVIDFAYESTPNNPIIVGDTTVLVNSIAVTGTGGASTITVDNGTLQMLAALTPSYANNTAITWSVTNSTGVATISPTGLLTAVANGTVTVTATNPISGVSGTMVVTLSNQIVPIQTIVVNGQSGVSTISIAGGTLPMVATITPAYATNQAITWSITGGTGFGTIDAVTGMLTAVANGTVIVKGATNDGTNLWDDVVITISNQPPTLVNSITVAGTGGATTISTNNGNLQMLKTILPFYASNQNVVWSVTNGTGVANISPTGLLNADVDGTVTVTATTTDGSGLSGSIVITLSNQVVLVSGITVTSVSGATSLNVTGGSLQLQAAILPTYATFQNVTWSVTNGTGSASISPTGNLTAISNGTVTAKATATDGSGIFGTLVITLSNQIVFTLVQNITVSSISNNLVLGNSMQMYKTIAPALATVQNVNWTVVNGSGTATINANGLLTGTGLGEVTVLATALDTSGKVGSKVIHIIPVTSTGINDVDIEKIAVTPNPFVDELTLANLGDETFDYVLQNSLGQIVKKGKVNSGNHIIHLSSAAKGVYFMQLIHNKVKLAEYKVVKLN
jgi:uncharacterized protein YjdB